MMCRLLIWQETWGFTDIQKVCWRCPWKRFSSVFVSKTEHAAAASCYTFFFVTDLEFSILTSLSGSVTTQNKVLFPFKEAEWDGPTLKIGVDRTFVACVNSCSFTWTPAPPPMLDECSQESQLCWTGSKKSGRRMNYALVRLILTTHPRYCKGWSLSSFCVQSTSGLIAYWSWDASSRCFC